MIRLFLIVVSALAVVLALMPAPGIAEDYIDPHWYESPIHFSAGFKFGLAFPAGDEMQDVYGTKGIPFYSIEAAWKMVHELELHAEMSYWWEQGRGVAEGGKKTNEKYKIHIAPAELGLIYRFNFVNDQIVVPYIGGGGIYSYYMEERLESSWKRRGGKWGVAGKAGLMLLLDNAEKKASGALEREWKINNTYLIYSFKYSYLNNFDEKAGLDLSNQMHTLGVLFEF